MKQAKVLNEKEFRRLLAVVDAGRHPARNRAAVALSFYAGLRVGEIAALTVADAFAADGTVRDQVLLKPEYTKSKDARRVLVSRKLRVELERYRDSLAGSLNRARPLIQSQKGGAFSANALCQLFGKLYAAAGIDGASSHSGRRSFITRLAHGGISARVIMELAGHKHLSTTQRYIDVNDEMCVSVA